VSSVSPKGTIQVLLVNAAWYIILYLLSLLTNLSSVSNFVGIMDRLPPETQEQLKKMNTARLAAKLGRAVYDLDCLDELDRSEFLEALAETILAEPTAESVTDLIGEAREVSQVPLPAGHSSSATSKGGSASFHLREFELEEKQTEREERQAEREERKAAREAKAEAQLAHEISAAGHLGVAKTKDRLLHHFYWPSISRDTCSFCRSWDVCQRIGKGPPRLPAPLHSLPLMSELFCQVAIDIVGPLPVCKDSGNRFILTLVDLCIYYPQAIPLKQHTAFNVAQALSTVFSRFGFSQEILSDQGTDFMSEVMQIFLHDFGIKHIRTSPYHPQSNGASERFNETLKSMLRSLMDRFFQTRWTQLCLGFCLYTGKCRWKPFGAVL